MSKKRSLDAEGDERPVKRARSSSVIDWLEEVDPIQPPQDAEPSEFIVGDMASEAPPTEDGTAASGVESGSGSATTGKRKDGSINAYHKDFASELDNRLIFLLDEDDDRDPENLSEFVAALRRDRITPELSSAEKTSMRKKIMRNSNELKMGTFVLPKLFQFESIGNDDKLEMIPNMGWELTACIARPSCATYPLVPPQPDQVIGWSKQVWNARGALKLLGDFAKPVKSRDCYFPSIAIEGKGSKGSIEIARLQCLHDGATMLWNLHNVRACASDEASFFNKIRAITISVTTQSLEICYHWAVLNDCGDIEYLAKPYYVWSMQTPGMPQIAEARKSVRNAIDWMLKETREWVETDLKVIEERFTANTTQAQNTAQQKTPPASNSTSKKGKRKALSAGSS